MRRVRARARAAQHAVRDLDGVERLAAEREAAVAED